MSESLEEMRHMLRFAYPLGEPTPHEREMLKPYEAPKPHPCDKCGEETLYSPPDAVNLHTREPIDEWDNRYFCRADYVPKHRLTIRCPNCEALYDGVVPVSQDRLEMDFCRLCGHSLNEAWGK